MGLATDFRFDTSELARLLTPLIHLGRSALNVMTATWSRCTATHTVMPRVESFATRAYCDCARNSRGDASE